MTEDLAEANPLRAGVGKDAPPSCNKMAVGQDLGLKPQLSLASECPLSVKRWPSG